MGAVIEVKYFNTFILKKTNHEDKPIWNGSLGIPQTLGGYPAVDGGSTSVFNWAIEESRIRGGYNNTTVDFGVKAYLVEPDPNSSIRISSLIYSGIFNSTTGINQTNVFSVGEDITKTADPSNGSIQKLHSQDTNIVLFQEGKVSRALIDKDAIYSAEGGGAVTASNLVIGVIQPYAGEYGISKNPESFANYGYRIYFADKNNNAMLRLSRDGITEISAYGMRDYFRDEMNRIDTNSSLGFIRGGFDVHNDQYVVSTQTNPIVIPNGAFKTLSFDERINGWTSFYSYKPDQIFSIRNNFYSIAKDPSVGYGLFKHYDPSVNRGNFYNVNYLSTVTAIFNPSPSTSKNFNTVSYEGSNGWKVKSFISDSTGSEEFPLGVYDLKNDSSDIVRSYYEGEYVSISGNGTTASASVSSVVSLEVGFKGPITVGALVSGLGVIGGTTVVSFVLATRVLTLSQNMSVANKTLLSFNADILRADYNTLLGTTRPPYSRTHVGFDRKENKYVANLVNNSTANQGEVIWGNSMSGIKGFYASVTFSTDTTTQLGGDKQLFSIESNFVLNNGY